MSSDEYSIVEEEYLVYAELRDNTDPTIFNHAESNFKSFALDSDQPILTIGGQAFVGTYKDTVGTAVFLEESQSPEEIGIRNEPLDPLFVNVPAKRLRYVGHTRKTLEMSRVLLIEKNKQPGQCSEDSKEQTVTIPVELNKNGDDDGDAMLDIARKLPVGEEMNVTEEPILGFDVDGEVPGNTVESEESKVIENIENMQITSDVDS